jgi:site-specific DNA recombinase
MQVALYVRVSTDRQQHAQTIEQQVTQLQTYVAAREGWTVREEHIFRDDGHSGAKLDRPGLDALRDHAARATFDVVLLTAPDRLARNFVHQMVVLEELGRRGVRVVFCDRPLRDDPHEQLVTQIRGAVAEYERTLIADRMRRGRQARLRSGQLLPWTRAPYGYRLHPERPRDPAAVGLDTVAAAVVQDLFAAYAAGGVTLHTLAAQLTARGVPTPTGKPIWRPTTIRGLLTNPAYKGQAASGRLRTAPARQRKSALEPIGKGVGTTAHPPQEWITVVVPALVAAEQFDLVQRRLAANQQNARRNTTTRTCCARWSAAASAAWPARGSPAPPPTPAIATTAAWASRRGSAPAAPAAARRGSSPPPSSTSWCGRISARCCSIRSWSRRRWSAPTAAPGCPRSCAVGRRPYAASGRA